VRRSYSPHSVYSTLYNIGLVLVALGHSVEAKNALQSPAQRPCPLERRQAGTEASHPRNSSAARSSSTRRP